MLIIKRYIQTFSMVGWYNICSGAPGKSGIMQPTGFGTTITNGPIWDS